MIWVLVVVVCLVVILAQLLLAYQKRAARLRVAQAPVRKQIASHKDTLVELAATVRRTASEGLAQLDEDMRGFTRRSGHAANVVAGLDAEAQAMEAEMKAERDEEEKREAEEPPESRGNGESGESGDDEGIDELLGSHKGPGMRVEYERLSPVGLVRAIRQGLEETYEYMEGLRTDAAIVRQTVERLGAPDRASENGRRET